MKWSPLLLLPLVAYGAFTGTGTVEVVLFIGMLLFIRFDRTRALRRDDLAGARDGTVGHVAGQLGVGG